MDKLMFHLQFRARLCAVCIIYVPLSGRFPASVGHIISRDYSHRVLCMGYFGHLVLSRSFNEVGKFAGRLKMPIKTKSL